MESTLTFKDGYQFGVERHALLEECRKQGEEFLRGRARNGEGKYVYDILSELKTKENELYKTEAALPRYLREAAPAGYLRYKVLHPLRHWRDNRDINDIILSEVRPV